MAERDTYSLGAFGEVVQEYMERIGATFDVERTSNVFAERCSAGEQRRELERTLGRFVYENRHSLWPGRE